MRVSVVRGGGFTGLMATTSLDSAALDPDNASTLRNKVEEAGLFGLPSRASEGAPNPDAFDYALTVEDGDRRHTVLLSGDALPEGVRAFISWLDSAPGRQEQFGPAGGDQSPA